MERLKDVLAYLVIAAAFCSIIGFVGWFAYIVVSFALRKEDILTLIVYVLSLPATIASVFAFVWAVDRVER